MSGTKPRAATAVIVKKVRTSSGETTIQVPRDRKGEFEPRIVQKHAANTNELAEKIIGM